MTASNTAHARAPVFGTPVTRCPGCGSIHLQPIDNGFSIDYRCTGCGDSWHAELGFVHRVPSITPITGSGVAPPVDEPSVS